MLPFEFVPFAPAKYIKMYKTIGFLTVAIFVILACIFTFYSIPKLQASHNEIKPSKSEPYKGRNAKKSFDSRTKRWQKICDKYVTKPIDETYGSHQVVLLAAVFATSGVYKAFILN